MRGFRLEREAVPRRRRNADGSLVTPLSPRQQEALAKGRAALAAKLAGQGVTKETVEPVSKETRRSDQGARRRVERVKVRGGSKETKRRTKASGSGSSSSSTRKRAPAKAKAARTKETSSRPGFLERMLRET